MTQGWDVLAIIREVFESWIDQARQSGIAAVVAANPEAQSKLSPSRKSVGDVAVIHLGGYITQKPNIFTLLFGGTSTEGLTREIRSAVADPTVGSIILDVDSPGGEAFGVAEAASAIRSMRGTKPMVAVANPVMASAAYWLASQADEVIAAPSSIVGSIGAFTIHVDESAAIDQQGLKVTPVSYGRMKVAGASFAPLSDEAKASMQARVDYFGKLMETDIGKARGISAASVHERYGQGDVFTPPQAKQRGLIDRMGTLEEVAGMLAKGKGMPALPRAASDPVELAAHAILADLSNWN